MKKITITLALEGCKLKPAEMNNVEGGGGCTWTDGAEGHEGLSKADAEHMVATLGGKCTC